MNIKVIGRDRVGWSIDKDRAHLEYFLGLIPEVRLVDSYLRADVFFFVWHDQVLHPKYILVHTLKMLSKIFGKRKKIIAWITNDITQSARFLSKKWNVDVWVSPSEKVSIFLKTHRRQQVRVPFFVSPMIFRRLGVRKEELARHLGIDADAIEEKIIIGSFQRDSLGSNLLAPKWQKNPDLLIDICKKFPTGSYVLLIAGPRRHYVVSRCIAEGIPYIFVGDVSVFQTNKDDMFINNLDEETINMLYNITDLCLVVSKSEGGPKAIMEASLSKTLIFSTDVGLAKDFLHPDLIYAENSTDIIIRTVTNPEFVGKVKSYIEYNYEHTERILSEQSYLALVYSVLQQAGL